MDGLEDCCCTPPTCSAALSTSLVALAVWTDQRGNPPYPCIFYRSLTVTVRDTVDNSLVGTYTLRSGVEMAGAGSSPLGRCRIENVSGAPPPAGHGVRNDFHEWVFGSPVTGDEVLAVSHALAQMVDWNAMAQGTKQTVSYDGSGNIQTGVSPLFSQPSATGFSPVAEHLLTRNYLVGDTIINTQDIPSWFSPAPLSNFGNVARSQFNASTTVGKLVTPGAWCRRATPYSVFVGDPIGPSYCGVGTIRTAGSNSDANQPAGGTFIITPEADANTLTRAKCAVC